MECDPTNSVTFSTKLRKDSYTTHTYTAMFAIMEVLGMLWLKAEKAVAFIATDGLALVICV